MAARRNLLDFTRDPSNRAPLGGTPCKLDHFVKPFSGHLNLGSSSGPRRPQSLWVVPNGDGPKDHPLLKNLHLGQLGHPGRAALLITKG